MFELAIMSGSAIEDINSLLLSEYFGRHDIPSTVVDSSYRSRVRLGDPRPLAVICKKSIRDFEPVGDGSRCPISEHFFALRRALSTSAMRLAFMVLVRAFGPHSA